MYAFAAGTIASNVPAWQAAPAGCVTQVCHFALHLVPCPVSKRGRTERGAALLEALLCLAVVIVPGHLCALLQASSGQKCLPGSSRWSCQFCWRSCSVLRSLLYHNTCVRFWCRHNYVRSACQATPAGRVSLAGGLCPLQQVRMLPMSYTVYNAACCACKHAMQGHTAMLQAVYSCHSTVSLFMAALIEGKLPSLG